MRVAVTRALPEALTTAERIRARGAEPVLAPLLAIEQLPFSADTTDAQALLFTSSNGVRAFAHANAERALSVLAVGDATAAAAHEEGFADVRSAGGDAAALVAPAKQALDPRGGKVLHISGMQVATDIAAALAEAGYTTERHIAYDAVATSALPPALHEPIDIVLFHSARAASAYLALGAPLAGRIAACLSPAVAEAARGGWTRVVVSPAPREDALLAAALGG
jgi:uroporphyrinogen-III synthase